MFKVRSPTFHHCLHFLSLHALHGCYTCSLPSPSHLLHPQLAIIVAFCAHVAPTTCHCLYVSCTSSLPLHYNYINYSGQVKNKFKNKNKIGGSNSQHYNWKQEETDTMDRNNSRDNVKGKGRGKGSRGPSCHHNINWGHDEGTALINCKHKEQIALKQVIDPHTNMIPII